MRYGVWLAAGAVAAGPGVVWAQAPAPAPAKSQSGAGIAAVGLFTGKEAGGPVTSTLYWESPAPEVRVVAIGQAVSVGLGSNPLTAGWGQLVVPGGSKPIPTGGFEPPLILDVSGGPAVLFGGTMPAGGFPGVEKLKPTPATGPATADEAAGTGAKLVDSWAGQMPLLGLQLKAPTADAPGEVMFELTNADGSNIASGSAPVDAGGFWGLVIGPTVGLPGGDGDGGSGTPGGGNGNGSNGGGAVTTPEPGTLALAGVGAAAALGWRRARRRRSS